MILGREHQRDLLGMAPILLVKECDEDLDIHVGEASAQGDIAQASLVSSTRFIDLTAFAWINNTMRVVARNISAATFDLAAATLSVGVVKRRVA